jgi:hypothetical protein
MAQLIPPGIGVISSVQYTTTSLQANFERAVRNEGQAAWLKPGAIHENVGYDIDGPLRTAVEDLNNNHPEVGVIVTVGGLVAAIAARRYSANKPFLSLIGGTLPMDFPGTIAGQFYGGINLHTFSDNDTRFTSLTQAPANFSASQICLLSNPNSAMANVETTNWPSPPRGKILTARNDAEIRSAFTEFRTTATLAAMIISADPFFQDHKEVVIEAANDSMKYVCYPLQVFANNGGRHQPHPNRHRKHGPKLATEYYNLGAKTAAVIRSGAASTLDSADSTALTGTGGRSLS